MISSALSTAHTFLNSTARTPQLESVLPDGIKDRFTPSEPTICGLPDPRKYPDFNKNRKDHKNIGTSPSPYLLTLEDRNPRKLGDLDSPLWVDGKVTSKRKLIEKELEASEKAHNEKLQRIAIDPKSVMGGLDSPLWVDGKITTKRQLILDGKADPKTFVAY